MISNFNRYSKKGKIQVEVWDNIKMCQIGYQVVSAVRLAKSRD